MNGKRICVCLDGVLLEHVNPLTLLVSLSIAELREKWREHFLT